GLRGARDPYLTALEIGQAFQFVAAVQHLALIGPKAEHLDALLFFVVLLYGRTEYLRDFHEGVDIRRDASQVGGIVDRRIARHEAHLRGADIEHPLPQQLVDLRALEAHFVPRLDGGGDGVVRRFGNHLVPERRLQFLELGGDAEVADDLQFYIGHVGGHGCGQDRSGGEHARRVQAGYRFHQWLLG